MSAETTIDERTFCAVHPDRETTLRCNKCERYMCVKCAVQTPVGYRCRECVRGQEDRFFQGTTTDYLITAGACTVGAAVCGVIMTLTPVPFFIAILIGAPAGGLLAQAALYATYRRRGRYTAEVAVAAIAVGALLGGMLRFTDLELWIFVVLASTTAYARFKWGITRS